MKLEEAIKIIRKTKEGFPKHKPIEDADSGELSCYYCGTKLQHHQKKCNYCYTEQDWSEYTKAHYHEYVKQFKEKHDEVQRKEDNDR